MSKYSKTNIKIKNKNKGLPGKQTNIVYEKIYKKLFFEI